MHLPLLAATNLWIPALRMALPRSVCGCPPLFFACHSCGKVFGKLCLFLLNISNWGILVTECSFQMISHVNKYCCEAVCQSPRLLLKVCVNMYVIYPDNWCNLQSVPDASSARIRRCSKTRCLNSMSMSSMPCCGRRRPNHGGETERKARPKKYT